MVRGRVKLRGSMIMVVSGVHGLGGTDYGGVCWPQRMELCNYGGVGLWGMVNGGGALWRCEAKGVLKKCVGVGVVVKGWGE